MTKNIQGNSHQAISSFLNRKLYKPEFLNRNSTGQKGIFKVMKGKKLQPRILYPARLSFRFDGEIKRFPDKQKLREFSTTKPVL